MNDTLNMILDGGWETSFRIHGADNPIVLSLKFDLKLLDNPPILFSQYYFIIFLFDTTKLWNVMKGGK